MSAVGGRGPGGVAPPAVIELSFEPVVVLGDLVVRWQAVALAVVIAVALSVFVRGVRSRVGSVPSVDLAFVVLGAIPGAVVGGRVVHGLVFSAAYALEPASLLDLGRGSLSLAGAVVGGAITAGYLGRQLGYRVRPWADAAAVPLLLAIGGGKIAMLLGGAGQGIAFGGRGAVSFLGAGPWGSTDPDMPSYPTQFLEGAWALLGIPVVVFLERRLMRSGRGGRGLVLLAAVAWWLAGRAAFAAWWRDEPVIGPLGAEGLVALIVLAGILILATAILRRGAPPGPAAGDA